LYKTKVAIYLKVKMMLKGIVVIVI
jgi:hypothetical protein